MVGVFEKILPDNHIQYLLNLSKTVSTKAKLNNIESGSIYFTVPLPASIKTSLSESLGLDLSTVKSVPMRWVKGDTAPHIDRGSLEFENTYLVYLNNSPGEFILGDESYSIQEGKAFIFPEGLRHETKNTGSEPRLLLGPMSEQGLVVGGGISANGATETIYIRDNAGTVEYKINDGFWSAISFAVYINNTNPDPANNILKVIFTTDITLTNWNQNFWAGTSGIQFGSQSLNADGSRPTITISNAPLYRGLILNGTITTNGFNHIYIYNLNIVATGTSTLDDNTHSGFAGWVAGQSYARGASNNFIVNCSSNGPIGLNNGGIVGMVAAESGGSLTIRGCSSYGSIGQGGGGIAGASSGNSAGSVTCEQCWSEGPINGQDAGGIFGWYAGTNSGYALAVNCYSKGTIASDGGGIFGGYAGESTGLAQAQKCYSRGNIGASAGGIFSRYAAFNLGTCTATNCYSSGSISGYGIYGVNQQSGATSANCYAADNSWSDSTANLSLSGIPTGSDVGTTWVKVGTNIPYELNNMGYTPYTIDIINSSSELIQTYSQTVQAGQPSVEALNADASGNSYTIVQKSGGDSGSYSTITMSLQNGSISTTTSTVPGIYNITLRSVGSYNYTTFQLTVTATPISVLNSEVITVSCCSRPSNFKGADYAMIYSIIQGNILIGNTSETRKLISYSDVYKKQMAYASKY